MSLKNTTFKDSNLQEVDFTEADLTKSTFDNCNLARTIFENTVLEGVDFQTSYSYRLDPEQNKIKGAKFSKSEVIGLLDKYSIEIV